MDQQEHYKAADEVLAHLPSDLDLEPFVQKITSNISQQIYEEVQAWFEGYLLSDARFNVAGHIQNVARTIVRALLRGDHDAIQRFALDDFYEAETVRKAIAQHCGDEILKKRIEDLEKEIDTLKWKLNNRC